MAYVAMNGFGIQARWCKGFLNGVCRHERVDSDTAMQVAFLNGVCRHELLWLHSGVINNFLNGVCRHELRIRGDS